MKHEVKEFTFETKKGGKIKLTSKEFSFKIQDVLISRFGKEALDKINSYDSAVNVAFTLDNVQKDFPYLLNGKVESIELYEKNYPVILGVYHFFLTFQRNAWIRQIQSEKETVVSAIKKIQETFLPKPNSSSQKKN